MFDVANNPDNDGKIIFKLPPVGVPHHLAKTWTKRDCFVLMGCNTEKYWNAPMSNGAVSLWRKSDENIKFLEEWLKFAKDPRIITDDPNIFGLNDINFKDHRHDQSILSLLAIKYNLEMYRDPTQYGVSFINEFDNSPYPQLFNHHRQKL